MDPPTLCRLLLEQKTNAARASDSQSQALSAAVRAGSLRVCQLLLEQPQHAARACDVAILSVSRRRRRRRRERRRTCARRACEGAGATRGAGGANLHGTGPSPAAVVRRWRARRLGGARNATQRKLPVPLPPTLPPTWPHAGRRADQPPGPGGAPALPAHQPGPRRRQQQRHPARRRPGTRAQQGLARGCAQERECRPPSLPLSLSLSLSCARAHERTTASRCVYATAAGRCTGPRRVTGGGIATSARARAGGEAGAVPAAADGPAAPGARRRPAQPRAVQRRGERPPRRGA